MPKSPKNRFSKVKDSLSAFTVKSRRSRSNGFYGVLAFFFLLYLFIFSIGFNTSQKYKFVEAAIGQEIPFGQGNFQVVKREYNPKENLIRVDYWFYSESSYMDLGNINLEMKTIGKNDLENFLKTKVVRVDDNYYVTYIKGVEENFGAVKQFIYPSYIQLLKNKPDELKEMEFVIYTKEESAEINSSLTFETDPKKLVSVSTNYQINLLLKQIKELEQVIEDNKAAIKLVKKSINKLKEDLDYVIGDDLAREKSKIQSKESEILMFKKENDDSKEQIKLYESKIKLLKEKSEKLQE
ncbi:hypothetical protein [Carnobacterium maltaromaticum]|uniref:hypothetical protein n=1 Tax=Carnobacterium maltaromaticum TaxID=2751 RepID=UPI00295E5774|nr:hypothetical protein [Carnobacterium maltaromaticum]